MYSVDKEGRISRSYSFKQQNERQVVFWMQNIFMNDLF